MSMTDPQEMEHGEGESPVTGGVQVPPSLTRARLNVGAESGENLREGLSVHATLQTIASLSSMPINVHVRIPVPSFKVHSLSSLQPGSIVTTNWLSSEDLPVAAGDVRLAWAEFAIADHKRSVRITRISDR